MGTVQRTQRLQGLAAMLTLASLFTVVAGCTGSVLGANEAGAGGGKNTPGSVNAGLSPFRHLTRTQYANALETVFGRRFDAWAAELPPDEVSIGYEVGSNVSPTHAEGYLTLAERIGDAVGADPRGLLPCVGDTPAEACILDFIKATGKRAFRRSLTDDEVTALKALYDSGSEEDGAAGGLSLVVEGLLSAASFLYVIEQTPAAADPGDAVRLSGVEIATRLSLLLWDTTPSTELIDAAEAGELDTDDGVREQAALMLQSTRARDGIRRFYGQWLGVQDLAGVKRDGDFTRFPDPLTLNEDMRASLDAFIDEVVWEQDGGIRALLLSRFAYVTPNLAVTFDVPAPEGTEMMVRIAEAPHRAGILTHPAFLTRMARSVGSDPVHRGRFVRERLLCDPLPPPPDAVAGTPQDDTSGLTTREKYAEHSNNENCRGCHALMDPLGFALENFDQLGEFRDTEEGKTVDASGSVIEGGDADGEFDDAQGLAALLANSSEVERCMARQLFRFAVGRPDGEDDADELDRALELARERDGSIRALLEAFVTTPSFTQMIVSEGTGGEGS
jgi:hypothetical protein